MGVFTKAINFGQDFANTFPKTSIGSELSPLKLFQKDQFRKLNTLMEQQGIESTVGGMARKYFAGQTISEIGEAGIKYAPVEEQAASRIANRRRIVAGAAFGLAAANALDFNPGGITDKLTGAGMLGVHYGVGATMMKMGGTAKLAGIGYLGAAAVNTFRSGDNLGPM